MVHRGADSRLLANLTAQEKEYSKQWSSLLHASSSSLAGFTAYAAASEPTTSRAILNVAGVLAAADDALASYRRAIEEWRDLLKGLQQLEEEVGNIVRDREILVTRLIKASNKSASNSKPSSSNLRRFGASASASSSSVNLHSRSIPTSTKLAAAQSELQACETHLASKERELVYRRFQVIRDGLALRGRAMVDTGRIWTQLGDEIGGIVEQELGGGSGGSTQQDSTNKPLPHPADSGSSIHVPGSFESNISSEGSNGQHPQRRNSMRIPAAHAIGSEIGMPIPFLDTAPTYEDEGPRQSPANHDEHRISRPSMPQGPVRGSWVSNQTSDEDWQDANDRFSDAQPSPTGNGDPPQLLGGSVPTRPTSLLQRLSTSPSDPPRQNDTVRTNNPSSMPLTIPSAPGSVFHSEEYRSFRESRLSPTPHVNGIFTDTTNSSPSSEIRAPEPMTTPQSSSSSEGQVVTGRHVHVAGISNGDSPRDSPESEEYRYAVAPPRALEVVRGAGGETSTRDIGGLSVVGAASSSPTFPTSSGAPQTSESNQDSMTTSRSYGEPNFVSDQSPASQSQKEPTLSIPLPGPSPPFTPIPPANGSMENLPTHLQFDVAPSLRSSTPDTPTASETTRDVPDYGSLSKTQRKKQKKRAKLALLAKEMEEAQGKEDEPVDVTTNVEHANANGGAISEEGNLSEMGVLKVPQDADSSTVKGDAITSQDEAASYDQETIKQSGRKRSDEKVVSVFAAPVEGSSAGLASSVDPNVANPKDPELEQQADRPVVVESTHTVVQERSYEAPISAMSEDTTRPSLDTLEGISLPPPLPLPSSYATHAPSPAPAPTSAEAAPAPAPIPIPVPVPVPVAAPAATAATSVPASAQKEERRTSVLGRLFGRGRNSGSNKTTEPVSNERGSQPIANGTAKSVEPSSPTAPTSVQAQVEDQPPRFSLEAPAPAIVQPSPTFPVPETYESDEETVLLDDEEANDPTSQGAQEPQLQAHTVQGHVLAVPQGFPVPPNLSPMPTVQEFHVIQHVPAPQQESVSHFSHEATIVTPPSVPPPLPQQAIVAPSATREALAPAQASTAPPAPDSEPKLNQVAPEATVQRPYKISRRERKDREKEEKERQKVLEREERERGKAAERESKEREKREKLEKKQKEKNAPKAHKGLFGGLKGLFGSDSVEDDAHHKAGQSSGNGHTQPQVVETDGTATTWAPPPEPTAAPSSSAPFDTLSSAASHPKHERKGSKGLSGLFGRQPRSQSTHDLALAPTSPTMPTANGEAAGDQQPRYVVVENKIDFGAVSSRAATSQPKGAASKLKSKSGPERRRIVSNSASIPASTHIPMPATSTSFDIPRAPAPLNVEQIQAQAETERRAAAQKLSARRAAEDRSNGAPRTSEATGWKTRTDKNLKHASVDGWDYDSGQRFGAGGGAERMVPSYEPVIMGNSQGLQQRSPPLTSPSAVSLPASPSNPNTGLGRSQSQSSAAPGRRLKKPSHIPVPSQSSNAYPEKQRSPRTMNGVPPVPPLPTQSRPSHTRLGSVGDAGYISDTSGSVNRRGSGIPTRRTTSMSTPSGAPRNEFGATVLTTGGNGGPGGSIAPGGWGNAPQRNPSVNSGLPRPKAHDALGQGMAPPAVRRSSVTQGVTAPYPPVVKTTDTRNMPYPIPSVPGASSGLASMPVPRAPPPLNADPGLQLGSIIDDVARRNRQTEEQLRVLKGGGVMDLEVSVAPGRRNTVDGPSPYHASQGNGPSSSLQKSNTITSNLTASSSNRPHHSPLKSALKNPSRSPSPLTSNIGLPATQHPRATSPLRRGDSSTAYYQTMDVMAGDEAGHVSRIPTLTRQPASPPPPNAPPAVEGTPNASPGPEGPQRRKSVRVSLQPTFSPTPPAIDYEETPWQSAGQGNTSPPAQQPSSSAPRKPSRRSKDIWQDSSDEDEAYTKARSAFSRATAEEKSAFAI